MLGWQFQAVLRPFAHATLAVRAGDERLTYDLLASRHTTSRMTTGLEWTQRLTNGYSATGSIDAHAAHDVYSLGVSRTLRRQQYGPTLVVVRGRDGAPHDTQLRWAHTFTFGHDAPVRSRAVETEPPRRGRELLDLVSARPAFAPAQVIARVDETVPRKRIVALAKRGLPAGARVDSSTAAVTLADPVASILLVTRDGVPFNNNGQFVVVGNRLEIRPAAMDAPPPGKVEEYLVTLENPSKSVTVVALTVSAGSVQIDRITVTTSDRKDSPTLEFPARLGVPRNSTIVSDPVVVAGINVPVSVVVTGGEYSIDGGTFTSSPGSVVDRQVIRVRHVTASSTATTTTTTLQVGRTTAPFSSTTEADTTPAAFAFPSVSAAQPSTVVTSKAVVITGIDGPTPVTIAGGKYSVDHQPFTNNPGTISNGQRVRVQLKTASTFDTTSSAMVTIGRLVASFAVTTMAADSSPGKFGFVKQTDVPPGSIVVSNSAPVTGVDTTVAVSILHGEYSIGGGGYTNQPGTIRSGQTVRVRLVAPSTFSTAAEAVLTVGNVSAPFHVTTRAADTTPDAFSFTAVTDAAPNTLVVSNAITVTGVEAPVAIAITDGEYSVDGGAYTESAGSVTSGQTITVRRLSSPDASTTTVVTLQIGGLSGTFNVTTAAGEAPLDTTPDAFSFAAQTDVALKTFVFSNPITVAGITAPAEIIIIDGDYSIDGGAYKGKPGTVTNGQTVTVRRRSSPQFSTTKTATLTIGGVSGTFSVTTLAGDTTPDGFSFAAQMDVPLSTKIVSNTITVTGIEAPTPVSISGGEYAINGKGYRSDPRNVDNGDTITVRQISSSSPSTTSVAILTVGGVSGAFSITTEAADTTPDPFSFPSKTDVKPNGIAKSTPITVSGTNVPAPISVTGDSFSEYRINNGDWTAAAGTVDNGDRVRVRHTAAPTGLTSTTTTLTIGGVSGTFTSTTK